MEILVIVALVVIVAAINVRWWYRRRQGNSPTPEAGTAEGKTRQMNDVHRERRNDESGGSPTLTACRSRGRRSHRPPEPRDRAGFAHR